jgi:hypothetical protein
MWYRCPSQPFLCLRYSYQKQLGNASGTIPSDQSKNGIYDLGGSGGNGFIISKDSIIKMQVEWNGNSEAFELKPEDLVTHKIIYDPHDIGSIDPGD